MFDRRRGVDRLTSIIIRGTSFVVLLLVLGMLAQIALSALPLAQQASLERLSADELTSSPDETMVPRPSWVPKSAVAWFGNNSRRVWLERRADDSRYATVAEPGPEPGQWQAVSTRPIATEDGRTFVDIVGTGDWLLSVTPGGAYALTSLLEAPGVAPRHVSGQVGSAEHVVPMPGNRAWLLVRSNVIEHVHVRYSVGGPVLETLRTLTFDSPVRRVAPSPGGQRLLIALASQQIELWHTTTAERLVSIALPRSLSDVRWLSTEFARTADSQAVVTVWRVRDPARGIGWRSLFDPLRYEGYAEAQRLWQPTAASTGYEPKFSLVPLLRGTLKAALVALVLALPVAVSAAVFVGFFMTPSMRDRIKPAVELIAAFPTVVVGAVAAIWLAPRLMHMLAGLIGVVVIAPLGIMLLAMLWRRMRPAQRASHLLSRLPALLVVPLALMAVLGWSLGQWIEQQWFAGSLANYMFEHYGLSGQHRNSLLVGLALGFAIIPTIFSVAEDAIHAVPRAAAAGSLALGATQWQSFRDVVLPVALPGILSGVMLGFGRAMGETMILLLVSGNAPADNWNLLQGLRSISATLAIELPESAVASPHYRVLFLAALLLFLLTFVSNTVAQLLKRHLRRRYGFDL